MTSFKGLILIGSSWLLTLTVKYSINDFMTIVSFLCTVVATCYATYNYHLKIRDMKREDKERREREKKSDN